MRRIEWLKWIVRYGNRKTRSRQIRLFFAFELYRFGCRLNSYEVTHWLEEEPLPAGTYLMMRKVVPWGVKLLDQVFPFGKEAHTEYVPYTPEVAEEMRKAGRPAQMVEIAYGLGDEGRGE